jgi:ACT domain-containing protein
MKSLAKTARVNQAIEVIQHMNDGMTVTDACQEVGLPRSSYYDIVNKNPEAIAEYHEMVQLNARQQLGLILSLNRNVGIFSPILWFLQDHIFGLTSRSFSSKTHLASPDYLFQKGAKRS